MISVAYLTNACCLGIAEVSKIINLCLLITYHVYPIKRALQIKFRIPEDINDKIKIKSLPRLFFSDCSPLNEEDRAHI